MHASSSYTVPILEPRFIVESGVWNLELAKPHSRVRVSCYCHIDLGKRSKRFVRRLKHVQGFGLAMGSESGPLPLLVRNPEPRRK